MGISVAFSVVVLWGGLWTFVSYRPPRKPAWLMASSFFAAWVTTELAAIHLVWQGAAALAFVAAGALDHWPGWVGLAVAVASWAGLLASTTAARRTGATIDEALSEVLGPGWSGSLDPRIAPTTGRLEWQRVVLPFRFRRRGVERTRNLQYVDEERPHRRHRLDVYRRADAGPGAPVLLQIHGGGWIIGSKEQQGLPLMYHLAARGWVCVAINYRLSPRATWPDQLVDCKAALAWVRRNVAQFGGDPDYVVVTGGSAGGHLTTMMGLTANDPRWQPGFEDVDTRVRAFVPFYPVLDWTDRFGLRGRDDGLRMILERHIVKQRFDDAREVYDLASPMSHIGPDAPPVMIVHGGLDRLAPVAETREFVRMLRAENRSPVVYVELPGAHHAFEVFQSIRSLHTVVGVDRFLSWLLTVDPPEALATVAADPSAASTPDQSSDDGGRRNRFRSP